MTLILSLFNPSIVTLSTNPISSNTQIIALVNMKFGKSLSNQLEGTLPEWRDKFLSYKELKKKLKLIQPKNASASPSSLIRSNKRPRFNDDEQQQQQQPTSSSIKDLLMTREEIDFIKLLEAELEKFNGFFVEKEEEYIIRLKELQERVSKAKEASDELVKIRKEIVDFHGEMVLLENYSALNYTGLVKILKKYDKRTGAVIRLPFIQKVLQQPFFTMDLLYKLVKECELMLDNLFPVDESSLPSEIEHMESLFMKSTVSALRALQEIRSGSSTVSIFSLPPLQSNVLEEAWNKIPVLEQVAK